MAEAGCRVQEKRGDGLPLTYSLGAGVLILRFQVYGNLAKKAIEGENANIDKSVFVL